MRALISRQWKNCPFSVVGRKMALLSNAFWTCAFKEKADIGSIYLVLVKCIKENIFRLANCKNGY